MNHYPTLLLGTAMWGWTTPPATAHQLLDEWYALGFREVDAATNYPIDKDPAHFRLSERILLDWIAAHGIRDLQVTMKVGSLNNLRTPDHDLSRAFLLEKWTSYQSLFGPNLATFMLHWDNRSEAAAIAETIDTLAVIAQNGCRAGLSGIQHPVVYAEQNARHGLDFLIQLKHNVLQSDFARYAVFHGSRRFVAYGINAGGQKLGGSQTPGSLAARGGQPLAADWSEKLSAIVATANENPDRPPLSAMHELGMIFSFYQPDMHGILLGCSSPAQLHSSIGFYKTLTANDYRDVWEALAR